MTETVSSDSLAQAEGIIRQAQQLGELVSNPELIRKVGRVIAADRDCPPLELTNLMLAVAGKTREMMVRPNHWLVIATLRAERLGMYEAVKVLWGNEATDAMMDFGTAIEQLYLGKAKAVNDQPAATA